MTDPSDPKATQVVLGWETLMNLLNSAASRTVFWQVADLLDTVSLDDEEIDALLKMPLMYRQRVAASLIDYAETIREASRDLDAQLMRLTGELV